MLESVDEDVLSGCDGLSDGKKKLDRKRPLPLCPPLLPPYPLET